MNTHPLQQRLISAWFQAAQEGKELVVNAHLPNIDRIEARMREIQMMNPGLFSSRT